MAYAGALASQRSRAAGEPDSAARRARPAWSRPSCPRASEARAERTIERAVDEASAASRARMGSMAARSADDALLDEILFLCDGVKPQQLDLHTFQVGQHATARLGTEY